VRPCKPWAHVPKLVVAGPLRVDRVWRCEVCGEPLYEIP